MNLWSYNKKNVALERKQKVCPLFSSSVKQLNQATELYITEIKGTHLICKMQEQSNRTKNQAILISIYTYLCLLSGSKSQNHYHTRTASDFACV